MPEAVAARPYLYEVVDRDDETAYDCYPSSLLNADSLTVLQAVRRAADERSDEILAARMDLLREGDFAAVPYAHDPLSTAARANQAKQLYGEDSPEYAAKYGELLLDSERLFAEAFSRNTWEIFPKITQTHSVEHASYMSGDHPIMQVVDDGISPMSGAAELQARYAERREEVTVTYLGEMMMYGAGLGLIKEVHEAPAVSVQTISECSQQAIDQYQIDKTTGKKRSYDGQVPQIEKLMLRAFHLDPQNHSRTLEVLAMPGLAVNHDVVLRYLEKREVIAEGQQLSRTEVLGTQAVSTAGEGVIGMAMELDAIASEVHGKNIFLGEEVPADHPKDYASIIGQAAERKKQQALLALELTEYLMELEASGIDHWAAKVPVEAFVKTRLFEAVLGKPQEAAKAFDDETALKVEAAMAARQQGRYEDALRLEQDAYDKAPPANFCAGGGDSCGIQAVDKTSTLGAMIAGEVGLAAGESIAIDKIRRCKAVKDNGGLCGGVIGYVYSDERVKKVCLKCMVKENKVSKVNYALAA